MGRLFYNYNHRTDPTYEAIITSSNLEQTSATENDQPSDQMLQDVSKVSIIQDAMSLYF